MVSRDMGEDIGKTCWNLAIMNNGYVIFQGTTADLTLEARGKVWTVTTAGSKPQGDFTVVSTMHMGDSVQYRLVGELASPNGAVPTEPSLYDSYVCLMR